MKTLIKILALILIALYFSACGTRQVKQETRIEWDVDASDLVAYKKHMDERKQCEDFAFKAIINGSRFQEADIINNCLYRKGYKTRIVSQ